MRLQRMFDVSAAHLIQQGERSFFPDKPRCAYFGDRGLQCAAGVFLVDMPDVRETCEGRRITTVPDWCFKEEFQHLTEEEKWFANKLQLIHDDNEPDLWPDLLKDLAQANGLNYDVLGKEEEKYK